jgi:hypothetical protein
MAPFAPPLDPPLGTSLGTQWALGGRTRRLSCQTICLASNAPGTRRSLARCGGYSLY